MNASHSESLTAEKSLNESLNQVRSYEQTLTAYQEDSGGFNANLNQTALEIGAEQHGGNMAEAYRAAKTDPRLAQGWADEAVDRYLDKLPVGDQTPAGLQGGIYESRSASSELRHQINREDIAMGGEPDNRISETKNHITEASKSLGSQMTNGSAKIGNEIRGARQTTGKTVGERSNDSLAEGAGTAFVGTPGDAIDEVQKWFGDDDKKTGAELMVFTALAFFSQSLRDRFLPQFQEWVGNSVSKPHSPKEGGEHYPHRNCPNQRGQNEKFSNKQQNKPDNHSVHSLAGFDDQIDCTHGEFSSFITTITPHPSFASHSLGG
ncbi:MAG: hypothetical protein JKY27_06055 [Magnetovibrio sp.]|nr:hypothetical protein [Magnetovibrio sp.]